MKTLFITGSDLRHIYLVKKFTKYFKNFKWVIEIRDLNINHKKLLKKSTIYKKHVKDFSLQQKKYFKNIKNFEKFNINKISKVYRNDISNYEFNEKIIKLINFYNPNLIFSYGCQKIDIKKINKIKKNIRCFNIHGGILPEYKGTNTNFWPHINMESNKIGLTLHKLEDKIDSGEIYFQTSVRPRRLDTINKISCRAVKKFSSLIPLKIFLLLKKNFYARGIKKISKTKNYLKKDFKPKHIRIAKKNLNTFKKKKLNDFKDDLINIF
jgi:methionyl-tRNA formyltransferase